MYSPRLASFALHLLLAISLPACVGVRQPAKAGTLHHIGLVWLADPGNAADRQKVIDAAHRFAREIPEVRALSVGTALAQDSPLVDSTFDVCLVMEFDDQAAMERYAKHPVHERAAQEVFLPLARKLLFYDFVSE